MPAPLKGALVRETARRGSNVNDVAAGILAESFGIPYVPSGRRRKVLAGGAPSFCFAYRTSSRTRSTPRPPRGRKRERRYPRRARRRARRPPGEQAKGHHGRDKRLQERPPARRTRCASRSSASATAPTRSSRASSTTRTPSPRTLSRADVRRPRRLRISDIEFIAAFDVVKGKVGVDLADAIWAKPNDTIKFADVQQTGMKVSRGMTHDGIGKYLLRSSRRRRAKDDVVRSCGRLAPTSSSTTSRSARRPRRSGTPSSP